MAIGVRWRKVRGDLGQYRARTALVVASIAIGAFAVGTTTGAEARIGAYGESRQGGIVYEVVVVPAGNVPDGVRWNMTTTVAIKVGE